jgi:uncharacterized protein (DUF488 family)
MLETLEHDDASLAARSIRAVWREKLGGRRAAQKDSINRGWKNEIFRGYADDMQTQEFAAQMDWLTSLADLNTVTVTCAEAVPWRCHRSLICGCGAGARHRGARPLR